MRAVVRSRPGPVDNLTIEERPVPPARPGWVRIRIEGFGIDRSELHTRLGLAAMRGGMGRVSDGGDAEYTSVPRAQVIAHPDPGQDRG